MRGNNNCYSNTLIENNNNYNMNMNNNNTGFTCITSLQSKLIVAVKVQKLSSGITWALYILF